MQLCGVFAICAIIRGVVCFLIASSIVVRPPWRTRSWRSQQKGGKKQRRNYQMRKSRVADRYSTHRMPSVPLTLSRGSGCQTYWNEIANNTHIHPRFDVVCSPLFHSICSNEGERVSACVFSFAPVLVSLHTKTSAGSTK